MKPAKTKSEFNLQGQFGSHFQAWQLAFATRLQAGSEKLKTKTKRYLLVVFVISCSCICIRIATTSLLCKHNNKLLVFVQRGEPLMLAADSLNRSTSDSRVPAFKTYPNQADKLLTDSLVIKLQRLRPGLLDTLKELQSIYQNQNKMSWKRKHTL